MSRRAFRGALVIAGVTAMAWLASCAAILGLDDTLKDDDDAATDGSGAGPRDEGDRPDASTTDGPEMGAQEGGALDGGDAYAAPAIYWTVDRGFGDSGALVLDPTEAGANDSVSGTLEVVALTTAVYVFGVAAVGEPPTQSALVAFNVSDAAIPPAPLEPFGDPDYRLLGAFAVNGVAWTASQSATGDVSIVSYGTTSAPTTAANDSGALIARLVALTDASSPSFIGPAIVGGTGAAATVSATIVTVQKFDASAGTLLAESPDGVWFGGYADGSSPSAVLLRPGNYAGAPHTLATCADASGSGVTDFALNAEGLFALGYSGDNFALWPVDGEVDPQCIRTATAFAVDGGPPNVPYSFVRATVTTDQTIWASGSFGRPYLAIFAGTGAPVKVLAQGDGGFESSLDMTGTLPTLADGGTWYPGGLTAVGDYLYATFTSGPPNARWIVVRLTRMTSP